MDLVDSHAHLDFEAYQFDRDQVLARAWDAGLRHIVAIGSGQGAEGAAEAVRLASQDERLWATVGVHPHDASLGKAGGGDPQAPVEPELRQRWEDRRRRVLGRLSLLARHPKVVAIGEVGLDFHYDHSPRELQRELFRWFVRLARRLRLPLVIHAREDRGEVGDVLRAEHAQEVGGVVHCFSGDPSLQAAGLELGFSFGITGIVTFPKANALRSAVRGLPLERLVIETDSPYLAPVPHRGRRNEPAYVVEVARSLAEIKGVPLEDVARITTANARRLFGLDRREAVPPGLLAYPWKDALYLNLTNRCTLACTFCLKREGHGLGDIPLGLAREPTEEEVRAAIAGAGPLAGFSEVVFCGVGEPLLRPDLVIALGTWLRGQGARVRVNTDGLGSLIHGRDLANELRGAVDAVSVSLNAPDAATHERLCRPPSGLGAAAFEAVCGFIRRAVATLPEVTATAVALPGLDLDAVASLARSLGARFRARPLAGDWRADGIDLE